MENLHPGAKWSFRVGVYIVLGLCLFFPLIVPIIGAVIAIEGITPFILIGLLLIIVGIIAIGEIYSRLSYRYWKYEFAKDQLRIEKGIIWKKYSNIPYARIQNVDIRRGIIARLLGFSSVNIQTAGYSMPAAGGQYSEGYIPAVSMQEGEKIREFLMKKISKKR